jgi:hypothetical protein
MRTRYRIQSRGVEWRHDEIYISLYLIEIKHISCVFLIATEAEIPTLIGLMRRFLI